MSPLTMLSQRTHMAGFGKLTADDVDDDYVDDDDDDYDGGRPLQCNEEGKCDATRFAMTPEGHHTQQVHTTCIMILEGTVIQISFVRAQR